MKTPKNTQIIFIAFIIFVFILAKAAEIDTVKAKPHLDEFPPSPKPSVERPRDNPVPLNLPEGLLEPFEDELITPNIVGGTPVSPENAYPWMASLRYYGSHYCGGSLINPEWILTAAHCWTDSSGNVYTVTNYDTVVLGEYSFSIASGNEQIINVSEVYVHPFFDHNTLENDFALLKLNTPANLDAYVQTIALVPSTVGSLTGQASTVIGWGNTSYGGSSSDTLLAAAISILTDSDCTSNYSTAFKPVSMLCAGTLDGSKDSCQGDSGGPMFYHDGSSWKQAGVVSWGYECAVPGYPGIYSRVSSGNDWIRSIFMLNDDIADAKVINSLPYAATQNTVGATTEVGEPSYICGFDVGSTVWYSYTPSADGMFTVHTNGSGFDTVLHVFEDVGGLPHVVCNDDDEIALDLSSRVTFEGNAGTTYLISIGGYEGDNGDLNLTVQQVCTNPNSLCVTAQYPWGGQAFYPEAEIRDSLGYWVPFGNQNYYGTFVEFENITPGVDYNVIVGAYALYIVEENVTAPGKLTAFIESPALVYIDTKDTSGAYLNNSIVYFTSNGVSMKVGNTDENYFGLWASPVSVDIDAWNLPTRYYFYEPSHTLLNGETISLDASTLPYETVEMDIDGLSDVGYVAFSPTTYLAYIFSVTHGDLVHIVAPLDSSIFDAGNFYSISTATDEWYYAFYLPSITMDSHMQNNIASMGGTLSASASVTGAPFTVGDPGDLIGVLSDGYGNQAWDLFYETYAPDPAADGLNENLILEKIDGNINIQKILTHEISMKKSERSIHIEERSPRAYTYIEPQYTLIDSLSYPVPGTIMGWGVNKYFHFTASDPAGTWEGGFSINTGPAAGVLGDNVFFDVIGFPPFGYNGAVEITANEPIVAIGRPHIGSEIMAYNGVNAGATTVYLPMLFNGKWGYTSTFTVQNTSGSTANYSLTFKDAADGSTSCEISGESLPVHGVKTYDVTNLGPCDSGFLPGNWFGGAAISSDEPLAVVAKPDINGTDAVTYNGFTGGAATTYLPMLFRGKYGYQSAFYVQNLDPSLNANITIDFYDADGNYTCSYIDSDPIGPSVTRGYWMAGINDTSQCLGGTGFLASGWAGSAVINTGAGSSEIVAIGRPHLGVEVAAYNGFTAGGMTNYLPMLFRGQWGYDSAFYIQNISGGSTTISVNFFDVDGNYTCTYTDPNMLVPNATRGYWTPALNCNAGGNFPASGWAGSAEINTSQNVIAVGRPHLSSGQVVVYNAFTGGANEVYVPFNFRKWNGNETALYIQNLGLTDATATITFYDEEDGFYCSMEQVVTPGSAGAIWLAALNNAVCSPEP